MPYSPNRELNHIVSGVSKKQCISTSIATRQVVVRLLWLYLRLSLRTESEWDLNYILCKPFGCVPNVFVNSLCWELGVCDIYLYLQPEKGEPSL